MATRILVGTRKGLFVLQKDFAGVWQVASTHFLGDPISMALYDARDDSLHAALNLGHFGVKMRRSRDGGNSWDETAVPVYPPQPQEAKDETPWTLSQIWSLETGGADRPGTLWAGTLPGGLFVSRDSGDSWELVRSLWDKPERKKWFGGGYDSPGIHSIAVDPRHSDSVSVGVSCGGVWHTDDAGATWQLRASGMYADYMPEELRGDPSIQDPHRLVRCASAPDALWVQHHCGIFRSRDDGRSWQQIYAQPSAFGFAVAVHPQYPDTAWFVPAVKDALRVPVNNQFVVTRTRDGGQTFETLRNGLPQGPAYDLVYRHGLDVDASGDALVMGSTTGSLWISENGGDDWLWFSDNLPPIYCARFA
ncbi:MAG: putative glycosyl hydrolase [Verrucomicrobiaceae bacterium]|nr:putative glycosyl hydrolase [Verrucomicrobiaceae bacterium]